MRILKEESLFLLIDVQEKLMPHMHEASVVEKNIKTCVSGMKRLEIPMIVSEQYKKGLGETVQGVEEIVSEEKHLEKSSFSCCDDEAMIAEIKKSGCKNVIISGIESHICVLQTSIDLKKAGLNPVVVVDCVSSRTKLNKDMAIERMKQEGVRLCTYESILFELCRSSKAEAFRDISKLIK